MSRTLGTGLDIVEVARIADVIERHGDRFVDRVFSPGDRHAHVDLVLTDASGAWSHRWEGTGAVVTAEQGTFLARAADPA